MDTWLARALRFCIGATVVVALAGCSSGIRKGMLDGYDHAYASPCGAAFIGYHGRVERCAEE